jgi:hypothetical protein
MLPGELIKLSDCLHSGSDADRAPKAVDFGASIDIFTNAI